MAHPLQCWDIVLEGMTRRNEFSSDISSLKKIQAVNDWEYPLDSTLDTALIWENKTILITNAYLEILFASHNMIGMNGYLPEEVIGKKPTMFQGAATQADRRQQIRMALNQNQPFQCNILNYRKNGSLYNCSIEGYPVMNRAGKLVNYLAIESEIPL